jgi:hypothetical protein
MRTFIISAALALAFAGNAFAGFQDLTVDRVTGRRAVIQAEQAAAMDGELFSVTVRNASVASGGSWNCTLHAPASGDTALWAVELTANGAASLNVYEAVNASVANGTAATVVNRDRGSSGSAEAVFRFGSGVTATGGDSLLDQVEILPAGGAVSMETPLLLEPSGTYILEVLNRNGTAVRVLLRARWQER